MAPTTNWCIPQGGFSSTRTIPLKFWRDRTNQYLRPRKNGKRWGKFRMSYLLRAWFETATVGCFTMALLTQTSASPRHQRTNNPGRQADCRSDGWAERRSRPRNDQNLVVWLLICAQHKTSTS